MNERIKQIAEQALEEFKAENKYATIIVPNPLTEKFAELIVQKCANLFEIEYGTSEVSGNEVARVLQRHFGVKE